MSSLLRQVKCADFENEEVQGDCQPVSKGVICACLYNIFHAHILLRGMEDGHGSVRSPGDKSVT